MNTHETPGINDDDIAVEREIYLRKLRERVTCPTCQGNFASYPEFTAHIGNPTCANEIIASPATEDRATARPARWFKPPHVWITPDNYPHELPAPDSIEYLRADIHVASQKRIEALEAALIKSMGGYGEPVSARIAAAALKEDP